MVRRDTIVRSGKALYQMFIEGNGQIHYSDTITVVSNLPIIVPPTPNPIDPCKVTFQHRNGGNEILWPTSNVGFTLGLCNYFSKPNADCFNNLGSTCGLRTRIKTSNVWQSMGADKPATPNKPYRFYFIKAGCPTTFFQCFTSQ
jgi:hypothetical protein